MNSDIVEFLWRLNQQGVGFISSLDRTTQHWHDEPVEWWEDLDEEQINGVDLFFTPLTYEKPRRLNTTHVAPSILFADLDPVDPSDLKLRPHIAWETSPGNYQAVWLLKEPIIYRTKWADLNRRMTYTVEADRGGWAGSKVLRMPGSVNYKRGGVQGKLLWSELDAPAYAVGYLDDKLIPSHEIEGAGEIGDHPPVTTDRAVLDKLWSTLSNRVRWELNNKRVRDRSAHIVRVGHLLREEGVPLETAFHMLWWAPYNKWRFRNSPQRLWIELSTIYEK